MKKFLLLFLCAFVAIVRLAPVAKAQFLTVDNQGNVLGFSSVQFPQITITNTITGIGLTASTALTTDGSKNLASSATTATELGYVSGVTSSIQTQINTKMPQPFRITSSGLVVTVAAGQIVDNEGNTWSTAGGSVTLLANSTYYIVADMFNGGIHFFVRNIGEGQVYLGKCVTGASTVTSITQPSVFKLPTTAIPNTISKFNNNLPVRILWLGDSIMAGTGPSSTAKQWKNLLFNNTATGNPTTWNVANPSQATIDDKSFGGLHANYISALVGKVFNQVGSGADFTEQSEAMGPYYSSINNSSTTLGIQYATGDSGLLRGYDLAMIGVIANQGDNYLAHLENAVRRIRSRGVEVLLISENPLCNDSTGNTNYFSDIGKYLDQIGRETGSAVADTWAYYREGIDQGLTLSSDNTHPNDAGAQLYALAVRSVLNAYYVGTTKSPHNNWHRVMPGIAGADWIAAGGSPATTSPDTFPTMTSFIATPQSTTGSIAVSSNTTINTSIALGIKVSSAGYATYTLTSGQYAAYSFPCVKGVAVVRETDGGGGTYVVQMGGFNAQTNTYTDTSTIVRADDTPAGYVSGRAGYVSWDVMRQFESTNSAFYANNRANQILPGYPTGFRIQCTSGTLRIVGVLIDHDEFDEIPFEQCRFSGTWAEEAGVMGHNVTKWTDTLNDTLTIPFEGRGVQVLLNNRSASGQITWYLDGYKYATVSDYYRSSGSFLNQTFIAAQPLVTLGTGSQSVTAAPSTDQGVYGKHTLFGQYTGNNGSAGATAASNRRFQVYSIRQFK